MAALAALLSPLARSRSDRVRHRRRPQNDGQPAALRAIDKRVLLLWTIAAAFGSVGTNTTVSFFVEIGGNSGFEAATAGLVLSAASVLAIAARAGAGALADLRPRANPLAVAVMLLIGAVGLVVLSWGTPSGFLIGTLLLIAGVWSWHGLLLASAIRLQTASAAKSAAWLQVGLFSGPTVAPLIFGSLSASTLGIGGVVLAAAAATAVGAVAVLAGELYRRRGRES